MGTTDIKDRGVNMDRLTDKQRLFVYAYVKDPNATRAAIAAGYSKATATAQGNKLLNIELVKLAIGKLTKTMLIEMKIDAGEVLRQLFAILTKDPANYVDENDRPLKIHEMSYEARMAIDGLEIDSYTDDEGVEHTRTKLRLASKAAAIDMAMKHKGLFAAIEVKNKISVDWDAMMKPTDREEDESADPVEQKLLNLE